MRKELQDALKVYLSIDELLEPEALCSALVKMVDCTIMLTSDVSFDVVSACLSSPTALGMKRLTSLLVSCVRLRSLYRAQYVVLLDRACSDDVLSNDMLSMLLALPLDAWEYDSRSERLNILLKRISSLLNKVPLELKFDSLKLDISALVSSYDALKTLMVVIAGDDRQLWTVIMSYITDHLNEHVGYCLAYRDVLSSCRQSRDAVSNRMYECGADSECIEWCKCVTWTFAIIDNVTIPQNVQNPLLIAVIINRLVSSKRDAATYLHLVASLYTSAVLASDGDDSAISDNVEIMNRWVSGGYISRDSLIRPVWYGGVKQMINLSLNFKDVYDICVRNNDRLCNPSRLMTTDASSASRVIVSIINIVDLKSNFWNVLLNEWICVLANELLKSSSIGVSDVCLFELFVSMCQHALTFFCDIDSLMSVASSRVSMVISLMLSWIVLQSDVASAVCTTHVLPYVANGNGNDIASTACDLSLRYGGVYNDAFQTILAAMHLESADCDDLYYKIAGCVIDDVHAMSRVDAAWGVLFSSVCHLVLCNVMC